MHNFKRADDFLKQIRDIIKENPNYMNSGNFVDKIYAQMIMLGVKDSDKSYRQLDDDMFYKFNQHFQNKDNISLYPRYEDGLEVANFCHFFNKKGEVHATSEQIKIYIPLDLVHLKEGATEMFEFLEQEDIAHISKVAKKVRFDDVVVRVANKEDADKVNEFVKNNSFIQEGLIEPNPFAFTHNGLVHACDGNISYNAMVASYIDLYMQDAVAKNKLDLVNVVDFYKYVFDYYNTNLKGVVDENKIRRDFAILEPDPDDLDDYKMVSKLIIRSAYPEFNYNDFINHFEESKKTKEMNKLDSYGQISYFIDQSIRIMTEKYGEDVAKGSVKTFLVTGDYQYLTRTKNLRSMAKEIELKNKFDQMLNRNGQTIGDFWQERYGKNNTENIDNNIKM